MVRKKELQNDEFSQKAHSLQKDFNTGKSLDFLLNDILEQIKIISAEEKDAPYTKLIELFFKGVDLMEKLNSPKHEVFAPQNNFIEGVDGERI